VVTGARQTGKTSLLRNLLPNVTYVSLDLPSLVAMAETESERFLAQYPSPVIIDEVQRAPVLFRHIKRVVDDRRAEAGQFVLSGSQKFTLMREITDSLAGRCAWLELEALSAAEIREATPTTQLPLPNLLSRGLLPELWRQKTLKSRDFYAAYLATYLERDVREILNVTSLRDFERFIRIAAARSGQLLNQSDIAKDVGVAVKTIGQWISVLAASNQIVLLEPYFQNIGKRMVKTPKLYWAEPGLLCYLLGLDQRSLEASPYLGTVWETFLFAELRKVIAATESPFTVWYYRDQRAREIDFVLEGSSELRFIEAKWTEMPSSHDAAAILQIDKELRESSLRVVPGPHFVICRSSNPFQVTPGISAISHVDIRRVVAVDHDGHLEATSA
jgi:predicted AAA+ superfamily ATPase